MSRSWCRLYIGTRNHRKIRILREKCPQTWTYWYVLIELAGEVNDGGWIYISPDNPYTDKELAKELGIRREDTLKILRRCLEELELITCSAKGLLINSFAERNFESDLSTPRVRKYRERQKQETPNETLHRNVTETPQNRTEQNRNIPPIPPKGGQRDNGFDEFWKAYPKKQGKGAARKSWDMLRKKHKLPELSRILESIHSQEQSDQWQKDAGQFIPNPSTWLNQTRWEDEPNQFVFKTCGHGLNPFDCLICKDHLKTGAKHGPTSKL